MKFSPECRECLLTKIASEVSAYIHDKEKSDALIASCAAIYDEGKAANEGAAIVSGRMHDFACKTAQVDDLFRDIKDHDNRRAADVVAKLAPDLKTLHDAMTAAILGNAIDYGVTGHTVSDDLASMIAAGLSQPLAVDDLDAMLKIAGRIVYFTDNCGEVVFDMEFIKQLKQRGSHVTVVVKGGPMLNDVTMREANLCGLDIVADALYTGSSESLLGTHPPYFPPEVAEAVSNATLIIAKGLANYESLTEYQMDVPVAYLMMVKCVAVGRHITETCGCKVQKGDMVALLNTEHTC